MKFITSSAFNVLVAADLAPASTSPRLRPIAQVPHAALAQEPDQKAIGQDRQKKANQQRRDDLGCSRASGMLIPQPIALLTTCGTHAKSPTEQPSPRKLLEKWSCWRALAFVAADNEAGVVF